MNSGCSIKEIEVKDIISIHHVKYQTVFDELKKNKRPDIHLITV